MTISRSSLGSLAVLALSLSLAACNDEQPAPAPITSPTGTPVAEPPHPTGGRLAAAVRAAFPQGTSAEGEGGEHYVFTDHRLVDAPFGPVLVSEGQVPDPAHASAGRLDVTYLAPAGAGFTVAGRHPAAVVAGSFGQMSDWEVREDLAPVPTIAAKGGFTGQGYTCASTVLTELRADGPVEVATVPIVYDNSGAAAPAEVETYEGSITEVSPTGFTVRFAGTRGFNEHWVRAGGKWVRRDERQLPEC